MGKSNNYQEIPNTKQCPCGSGKKYYRCCKKKNFKFVFNDDGDIVKEIPIHTDMIPILNDLKARFKQYYGREPGDNDYFLSFSPVTNNELLLQAMYTFRNAGVSEDRIYAYYKSDGLFPCHLNSELLPQREMDEFNVLCEEYNKAMLPQVGNSINALQFVMLTTPVIQENASYVVNATIDVLNDYIHKHCDLDKILEYQISTPLGYCVFSAQKTLKTLRSVQQLQEAHLTECIYTLGRSVFENYMYICTINKDPDFFYKRLLPKIDQNNYSFATRSDGRIDYRKVIKHSTGKEQSIHVNISDLVANLPHDVDKEIYFSFYTSACQYVHVDVMSAKSYFSTYDPYDEIDPCLTAFLIIGLLSVLLLVEISSNIATNDQFRSDVDYLFKRNLQPKLSLCLSIINTDPEHKNEMLDLFIRRIS